MSQMSRKRSKIEYEQEEEVVTKEYCAKLENEPGTSEKTVTPFDLLEYELHQPNLNVQEIGRIIAEGIIDKQLTDETLKEFTKKMAKSLHCFHDINVWNLAEDLNKGTIDSRLVVIGNSFLWNLIKTNMGTIRDKFDHYQFKVSTTSSGFAVTKSLDLNSVRARDGEYIVMSDTIFAKTDLLAVFNRTAFRKNSDVYSKVKQFIKAFMSTATTPKCAIWHYSLRLSGTSHKKTLQDFPIHVMDALTHFLLVLADLGEPELELDSHEKLPPDNRFFRSLASTKEGCIIEFDNLKQLRENLITKFRSCVCDALNECREMPYNTLSCELMAPPRGKPLDNHHTVTWRQYETIIKRSQEEPTKENLEMRRELEYRLGLSYHHRDPEEDMEVNIDH